MAAELQQKLGLTVAIEPGETGQFDVFADDKLVYSKAETGRFPKDNEVAALLKAALSSSKLP